MVNELCNNCWRWQTFKDDCHFHWEGKRECSRHIDHQLDQERYKTVIDTAYLF